jgi:hypothetical protein
MDQRIKSRGETSKSDQVVLHVKLQVVWSFVFLRLLHPLAYIARWYLSHLFAPQVNRFYHNSFFGLAYFVKSRCGLIFILVLQSVWQKVNNLFFQLEYWPMLYPGLNTGSIRATYVRWFAAQMIVVFWKFFSLRWSLLSYIPVDSLGLILRQF